MMAEEQSGGVGRRRSGSTVMEYRGVVRRLGKVTERKIASRGQL